MTPGQFASSVNQRVGLLVKYAGLDVFNRVSRKTPVDTGRARGAWNLTVNKTDLSVPPEAPEGVTLPAPVPPDLGAVFPGDEVRATNNLVYITSLNNGHSKQAPAGFVEQSVEETRQAIAPLAAQIKRDAERGR